MVLKLVSKPRISAVGLELKLTTDNYSRHKTCAFPPQHNQRVVTITYTLRPTISINHYVLANEV